MRTDKPSRIDPEVVERELGAQHARRGRRGCVNTWLNCATRPPRSPSWQAADRRRNRRGSNDNADDTSSDIVLGLLWNLAELHRQLGNRSR